MSQIETYKNKYLKYKNKYLELKKIVGGGPYCPRFGLHQSEQACWHDSLLMILLYSDQIGPILQNFFTLTLESLLEMIRNHLHTNGYIQTILRNNTTLNKSNMYSYIQLCLQYVNTVYSRYHNEKKHLPLRTRDLEIKRATSCSLSEFTLEKSYSVREIFGIADGTAFSGGNFYAIENIVDIFNNFIFSIPQLYADGIIYSCRLEPVLPHDIRNFQNINDVNLAGIIIGFNGMNHDTAVFTCGGFEYFYDNEGVTDESDLTPQTEDLTDFTLIRCNIIKGMRTIINDSRIPQTDLANKLEETIFKLLDENNYTKHRKILGVNIAHYYYVFFN
jgi:hypothetical protein